MSEFWKLLVEFSVDWSTKSQRSKVSLDFLPEQLDISRVVLWLENLVSIDAHSLESLNIV